MLAAVDCRAGIPTRRRIPTVGCRIGAIVTDGDVAESLLLIDVVKGGVQESNPAIEFLIEQNDECSPHRRYRARSTDDFVFSIHEDVVAGFGIGIGGNVGHAAARLRYHRRLPRRTLKVRAVSSAGCSALRAAGPCSFGVDGSVCRHQPRAADRQDMRARAGKSTWFLPSFTPLLEPLSPDETTTVMPNRAASCAS